MRFVNQRGLSTGDPKRKNEFRFLLHFCRNDRCLLVSFIPYCNVVYVFYPELLKQYRMAIYRQLAIKGLSYANTVSSRLEGDF